MSHDQVNPIPEPIRGDEGATDPGPRDRMRDAEQPDISIPPSTDSGTMQNLKFSFSDSHRRIEPGGWSREVTVRELPVSTTLAGVNMRLKPGGVRELHWHKEAEWAYMISGSARVTAVDAQGRSFIDDVGPGDLWYFPSGIPHSIRGLADGCEFLLVFDDGSFSENSTFSITDWFSSTPPEVLAANFDIPEEALRGLPAGETYMYQGEIPGPLEDERRATMSPAGETPHAFTYRLDAQDPDFEGSGTVRIADSSNFEVSKTIAAALVEVEPGGIRELHWHPTNDEWQYYISGEGRMTVFAAEGHARTFDYRAGDVGYVPFAMGHYIQNTGDTPLRFLEMFRSDRFEDISLNQWMALTPRTLLEEHLRPDERLMQSLSKDKRPIVK
ncbi:oxalate decarboxylase family bicupin [Prescottella equi]|uniref:oxalate decarboxylase family bicupin n=1 Tax=Rhodococcus hoagii TaxID=43767 RepID=UPI0009BCFE09|nr:oxalate decarboxylase family bicupin [Prescottella equi]MBU4613880.1 oxalate decarboxylase family bicupin [Rhodococcus sp. GG48]MBM4726857.1 cupin domain-containing protein [Prescottella equi]NKR26020.1 cupin domain-containing protein [Prescottella equi]NKR39657.1 cupin domain-containing protein [Prescottella equi]NKR44577.1 cupin domain-containing protein [Prescottella equi]